MCCLASKWTQNSHLRFTQKKSFVNTGAVVSICMWTLKSLRSHLIFLVRTNLCTNASHNNNKKKFMHLYTIHPATIPFLRKGKNKKNRKKNQSNTRMKNNYHMVFIFVVANVKIIDGFNTTLEFHCDSRKWSIKPNNSI